MIRLLFSVFGIFICFVNGDELNIQMPGVQPQHEDAYLCHSVKVDNDTYFITKFTPAAQVHNAHHMLLFGCEKPGSNANFWNCGEMSVAQDNSKPVPVCYGNEQIIFSWAMGASGFKLPKGVSFMIGKGSNIKYLVLQAHYKNVDTFKKPNAPKDNSGLKLTVQKTSTPKLAGVYILGTGGSIPSHSTVYLESACKYTGKTILHPFAFRVHTHKLGKLVSGFIIHNNQWIEIGKKSPQEEQMFYPIKKQIEVHQDDSLAARCIHENKGDKNVKIGPTQNDEMCNFYFMYWVKKEDAPQLKDELNQNCFSGGYPSFSWNEYFSTSEFPISASKLPNSDSIIKESIREIREMQDETDRLINQITGEKTRSLYRQPNIMDDLDEESMKREFDQDFDDNLDQEDLFN